MLRQPNPDKNSKNNELNYLTPKKLTKEEKEKILNVFSMIDTDLENKPNPISNITHNSFYRVKSPYRLERFIENTKSFIFFSFL